MSKRGTRQKFEYIHDVDLDIDIKNHKILFEDIKRPDTAQQIPFTGVPFVILSKKRLDCTHGVDYNISTKNKRQEAKRSKVCIE